MFNQYPYYVLARKEEKEKYGKICPRTRPRRTCVNIIKFLGF